MELTLDQQYDKARFELARAKKNLYAETDRELAEKNPLLAFLVRLERALDRGSLHVHAPVGVSPYEDSELRTELEAKLTTNYPWLTFYLDHNFTYNFKVVSND